AAGCRVDEAADVAAYRSVLDRGVEATPTAPGPGEPLGLAQAFRLANARDEALAAEGEAYVRALIERRRASAAFLPRLFFTPRIFFADRSGASDSGRVGVDGALDAVAAVNPVRDVANVDVAALTAEARRELLLTAQDDLLLDVGRAYFAVLAFERRIDVLRASLSVQEERVSDARARVEAGLQRPLDVALAEARAADARTLLIAAESDARNGRTLLSFLVAWDARGAPLVAGVELPDPPDDVEAAIAEAVARRPETRAAAKDAAAAEAAVDAAYGGYWPTVSADVGAFLFRDSEPTALDWSSALAISIPLFTAGLVEADVREALSRLREARLRARRSERAVRREAATAAEDATNVRRRLEALAVRLDAARRALDLAEAQWSAGLATHLERLVAQDELLAVELEEAEARFELQTRRVEWARAVGLLHRVAGLTREDG
ncbi:MAG TPA: TolC family protein, partial [Planctomycetota bacterium]|nr:TolC family protein [Planctomycetota bacterium]